MVFAANQSKIHEMAVFQCLADANGGIVCFSVLPCLSIAL
jgi:hypothetical protein